MTSPEQPSGHLGPGPAGAPSPGGRVLVAMSGGVDSSVAAALLVRDPGLEVVGAWMRLHDLGDGEAARHVAGQLGIPFHVLDLRRVFADAVIEPFVSAYRNGRTPNPCVACNTAVKFGALLARARGWLACDWVATGHYARTEAVVDTSSLTGIRHRLLTGCDVSKDQSYFLYELGQEALAASRFPLGRLTKAEVRAIAAGLGLATASTPQSQEICFVPGGDYREVLRGRAGWRENPGPLLDVDGTVVGEHPGLAACTVGQRAGLGVALGEPRYVAAMDPATNVVRLGRREDLLRRTFEIEGTRFIAGDPPSADGFRALVRVRHRAPLVRAEVSPTGEGCWTVVTEEPVWAPAPGQAAVFYHDDEVLGGGTIARA